MNKELDLITEIINIYPRIKSTKGYIFFGTLAEKPPYDSATYRNWRLRSTENKISRDACLAIGQLLDSKLEEIARLSPRPHGFIKVEHSVVSLQWTTKDIAETMLDNIDKAAKLEPYRGLV